MQQAQNGAVFNVQAFFLYACNHRTKIITTKAIVLSINYANIAYTKHSNTMKNTQKHPSRARNAFFACLYAGLLLICYAVYGVNTVNFDGFKTLEEFHTARESWFNVFAFAEATCLFSLIALFFTRK
jgi:hypothetical protein